MGGTRKSACNPNHGVFGYHERKKSKWAGSQSQRLGVDSLRKFDQCGICLKTATDPLATPYGTLYCRECIYDNMLTQKAKIKQAIARWEEQCQSDEKKSLKRKRDAEVEQFLAFHKVETGIVASNPAKRARLENMRAEKDDIGAVVTGQRKTITQKLSTKEKNLPCFWLPEKAPDTERKCARVLEKPPTHCVDPSNNKKLKLKHLFPVKFLKNPGKGGKHKYICPVSLKALTNSCKLACFRPCGCVVIWSDTVGHVKKTVLSERRCPVGSCEAKLKNPKKDVISLRTAGSGFTAGAAKGALDGKKYGIAGAWG